MHHWAMPTAWAPSLAARPGEGFLATPFSRRCAGLVEAGHHVFLGIGPGNGYLSEDRLVALLRRAAARFTPEIAHPGTVAPHLPRPRLRTPARPPRRTPDGRRDHRGACPRPAAGRAVLRLLRHPGLPGSPRGASPARTRSAPCSTPPAPVRSAPRCPPTGPRPTGRRIEVPGPRAPLHPRTGLVRDVSGKLGA
ncbi:tRNA-dependent cyclodipeptide synthase [Streptomyces sp. NPDC005483]|uniref:tRNA-dependent cyclodipeptide synthase n=1 Tax=Streptomyces sp. NPDC005483 TaxID=3154882 RepID=UPI0033B3ECD6